MYESLRAGRLVTLDRVGTFADGVAVRRVGEETFRVASEVVDEIILVSTDEICAAIKDIFEDVRVVVEPAGALAVAGMKRYAERAGRARRDADRREQRREHELRPPAPRDRARGDRRAPRGAARRRDPRAARRVLEVLRSARRPQHHRVQLPVRAGTTARIFVGVSLQRGLAEAAELAALLAAEGYSVLDLSGNELAKLHMRHLVGGQVPGLKNELAVSVRVPGAPRRAARSSCEAIGDLWNISLFHYRNHGSDYGRVLAGVQVPEADRAEFAQHLAKLGYTYADETENPAYRLFLRASDKPS